MTDPKYLALLADLVRHSLLSYPSFGSHFSSSSLIASTSFVAASRRLRPALRPVYTRFSDSHQKPR
jgi:hypothetical protein